MTCDLRYDRCRYALDHLAEFRTARDELKSAPMEVRRLGLPLAIATWARRPGSQRLVPLLATWLFQEWGMLSGSTPQTVRALLDSLEEAGRRAPLIRSAAELEAEELMQTAKVLTEGTEGDGAAA